MEKIKKAAVVFLCSNTCIMIASAVFITLFWDGAEMGVKILWQIMGMSMACSLIALFQPVGELGKTKHMVFQFIDFAYICTVVLGLGAAYRWFFFDRIDMVAVMLIIIVIIYFLIKYISYHADKRMTERLNQLLEKFNKEKG